MESENMKFGTKAVHAGVEPDLTTGAIMTPIYQTSTYVQTEVGKHKGYEYSRTHNPTRTALHNSLATIENGKHGLVFGSGMAAIDAAIKLFKPGDEIISVNDLYGGTYRIFTTVFAHYGVNFKFVDMQDLENVEKTITPNTKLIWAETPTNPTMKIIDIEGICKIAKAKNVRVAVDNTFGTPFNQNPLDLGADIVMHSVTKYLGGHSDAVMGALITNDDDLHDRLMTIQNSCGAVPGPMDCFLVLRGIKTLHLRMKQHAINGSAVAEYLNNHPKVAHVYYPGLAHHKNHDVASKQMNTYGGMVSFTLKDDDLQAALKVVSKVKLFTLAESLGGVESLIGHPATMTHASIPKEVREKTGVNDSLIRLSVGVEEIDDIIADLEQAIG